MLAFADLASYLPGSMPIHSEAESAVIRRRFLADGHVIGGINGAWMVERVSVLVSSDDKYLWAPFRDAVL